MISCLLENYILFCIYENYWEYKYIYIYILFLLQEGGKHTHNLLTQIWQISISEWTVETAIGECELFYIILAQLFICNDRIISRWPFFKYLYKNYYIHVHTHIYYIMHTKLFDSIKLNSIFIENFAPTKLSIGLRK